MPKYLLQMHSSHEWPVVNYAAVDLDEELLQFIRVFQRIHIRACKEYDAGFFRVEFFNGAPMFYETLPPEFAAIGIDEDEMDTKLLLPDDFEIPEGNVRVECTILQIQTDSFRWTTIAKHTDDESASSTLYNKDVFDDE